MSLTIFGRKLADRLEEIVAPEKTALLVVDAQNDFCAPGGRSEQRGKDFNFLRSAIPNIQALLRQARDSGVLVVFIQNTVMPRGVMSPDADLVRRARLWGAEDPLITVEDSWGHRIIDEFPREPGDFVIRKYRQSGFVATQLEMVLRANRRSTVLVTGFETHGCVEGTARDAMNLDFNTVMVSDAMSSVDKNLHLASLQVMSALQPGDWMPTTESVLAVLRRHGNVPRAA